MCLTRVDKVLKPIDPTERDGWKVFLPHPEGYEFEFRGLSGNPDSEPVPLDTWFKARVRSLRNPLTGTKYQSGFHVFPSRKDAVMWHGRTVPLVKVKVRGVQTLGTQDGVSVMVCREMYVPAPKRLAKKGVAR